MQDTDSTESLFFCNKMLIYFPLFKPRGGWPRAELHYGSILHALFCDLRDKLIQSNTGYLRS